MASALSIHKFSHTPHGHGPGALGLALGTGVGFGSSVGLGYLYASHRDKWYGKYMPYIVAFGGKTAAAIAAAAGHGTLAATANGLGQSGVDALGLNLGVKIALKRKKLKAVVMDEEKAKGLPAADMLGALNESTARGMDRAAVDALYSQYA